MRTEPNVSRVNSATRWLLICCLLAFSGCWRSDSEIRAQQAQVDLQKALYEKELQQQRADDAERDASTTKGILIVVVIIFLACGVVVARYFIKKRNLVQEKIVERPVIKEKIVEKVIRVPVTIIKRTPAHDVEANSFVIDGLNVVHGGGEGPQKLSLLNLIALIIELRKLGASVKCFSDANICYVLQEAGLSDHAKAYRKLCSEFQDVFITVAGQIQADEEILDCAHRTGAIIITRDRFTEKKHRDKYPWLEDADEFNKHRVSFRIDSGKLECIRLGISVSLPENLEQGLLSLSALLKDS